MIDRTNQAAIVSAPQRSIKAKWRFIRARRDLLLRRCDWTQDPDSPLSADIKKAWATYRQKLRDITEQADPGNLLWPREPVTGEGAP